MWIPKNRRKIAYGRLQREIGKVLRKLCEYKGMSNRWTFVPSVLDWLVDLCRGCGMPRLARLDAPEILHHVMGRGIEKRKIFWGLGDVGMGRKIREKIL